jgi:nucleotide-binding universal stress UspA family protein
MNATFSPLGIVLAFIFLGALFAVLRWMFGVSPTQKSIRPVQPALVYGHRIIVPLLESVASMQAVELGCQLAAERQAKIIIVHVIEVPFTLALDVPLPGAEERGRRLLSQAERIVLQHGLQAESFVLRHRKTEDAILETARAVVAEAIVMGTCTNARWPSSDGLHRGDNSKARAMPSRTGQGGADGDLEEGGLNR